MPGIFPSGLQRLRGIFRSPEGSNEPSFSAFGLVGVGLALVLALTTLSLAVRDEPLHIDELRQVGYYTRDFNGVVEGALSQTQPPLDYLVGSITQRLLGASDVSWRLQGVVFSWLGLLFLGLLLRPAFEAAWLGVGLLGLSPVFLEFSAYARPYALPFFLMMLLVWCLDRWRTTGYRRFLVAGGAAAISLPLARTTEPLMFLGLMLLVLVIMRIRHGREASRWVRWPIAITAAGMAVSAVVIPRVETAQFRAAGGVNPLGATLSRLWSQILPVHERLAPLGLAGLAAGSVGIVIATLSVLRRRDPTFWWSLPLTYTALVAPVVFAAVSVTWVDYFDRYAYFAAPAIVLGVGLVVQSLKSSAWRRAVGIVLLLTAVPAAVTALTTAHRPDYEKASEVSNRLIDEGNLVLYEQDSSIAAFRPAGFPGVPLYVPASSPVISTEFVARDHLEIEPGKRPLILVLGLTEGIPGWIEVEVSDQFQMLIPEHEPQEWSFVEQARSLWLACEGFPPENGSYLCVSAVRAFFEAGDIQAAKSHAEVTLQRLEGSSVRSKIEDFLKGISPDLVD